MAVIRRTQASQPLATGSVVQFPSQSPIGPAISSTGDKLQNAAERFKQKRDELDEFKASRQYAAFKSGRMADLDKLEAKAEPGAPDLMMNAAESWNTAGREFVSSIPAHLQERYGVQLESDRAQFEYVAAGRERDSRYGFYRTELDKALPDLQKVLGQIDFDDTASIDSFRQQGEAVINATGLPSNEKKELLTKWRATAVDAVAMSLLQKDPAALKAEMEKALGINVKEDIGSTLEAALSGRESSGNTAIVNPLGYAGLFQFGAPRLSTLGLYTPGEGENLKGWSKSAKDAAGKWSGTFKIPGHPGVKTLADFLASPEAQRAAFQVHGGAMDKEIDERGLENFIGETVNGVKITRDGIKAMIHLGGPGGARRALRGESVTDANGTEVLSYAKLGLPGAVPTGDRADPRFQDIPLERRFQLYKQAQSQLRASDAQYVNGVKDYTASLRAGNLPDGRYAEDELISRLGSEDGPVAAQAIQDATAYGQTFSSLEMATPEEVNNALTSQVALLTLPEGFRQHDANAASIEKAIKDRDALITDDPALYSHRDEATAAAYKAMADAKTDAERRAASARYAAATLAVQDHLGLFPEAQRILSKQEAQAIVSQFGTQPEGGQNAAELMRSIETQWGKHWPQVFGELSEDLPGTALVVGAMNRPGQERAAERLAEAAALGTKALEDAVHPDTAKAIRDGLSEQLSEFAATLSNNPGGARTYLTFQEGVQQLALAYASDGDTDRALQRAYDDVLGKAYTMVDTYRVPIEHDADAVSTNAERILQNISGGLTLPTSLAGLPEAETEAAYLSALKSQGFWVTSPDESGLTLYDGQRSAVVTTKGLPMSMTWQEILDLGADMTPQARGDAEARRKMGRAYGVGR